MPPKTSRRRWWWWILLALLAVLVGYRVANRLRPEPAKTELPIAVRAQTPEQGSALLRLEYSGTVSAIEEANAYSRVPGKLVRYLKAEGDRVRKDETLAWVERDEVGLNYSLSPVKSPLDGLMAERFVDIGESVAPAMGMSGTPVIRVVNPRRLEVAVPVIEKDAALVAVGQPAEVRVLAYPGQVFPGSVTRVSPVVDQASLTTRALVRLEDAERRLKPGMFAEVALVVDRREDALLLPVEALLKENQQHFVYLVSEGRAARRDVTPGWSQGEKVEIRSGLTARDVVVVSGQTRLVEGSRVKVED